MQEKAAAASILYVYRLQTGTMLYSIHHFEFELKKKYNNNKASLNFNGICYDFYGM